MKKKRLLNLCTLTLINVAAIGSVKNWPLIAEYGLSSLSYLALATLLFFLPLAFITAELATTWPKNGGIYVWIKEAFGHRTAFLAIWFFWLLNAIWYPTLLSFIAVSMAYSINPALALSPFFTLPVILLCFWSVTLINLLGIKISGWISSVGAILGTVIPGLLIISLGLIWWIEGKPLAISLTLSHLIPNLSSINEMVFFTGVLLSFCGIEMSAIHAKDVKQPEKNYPRAILFSGIIIWTLSILGVLSIAAVVPHNQLSLISGALQAFSYFVEIDSLAWIVPLMALFMILGALGSLNSWVIASARGLLAAAKEGDLPPYFRALNAQSVPARLLVFQAFFVSLLSLLFAFMATLNNAFWILSSLVAQLYLIIYVLLFIAAIKLRYLKPDRIRPYRIPGGKIGIWVLGLTGIASSLFAIFIGFFPPTELKTQSAWLCAVLMLLSLILAALGPSLILLFKKPSWKNPLSSK